MENGLVKIVREALKTNQFRMHPNGFYQLDLMPNVRLHIWPPEKQEHQKNYNPIHDHAFSFHSFILTGRLMHYEYNYKEDENGKYQIYDVVPVDKTNTIMEPTGKFVDVNGYKVTYLSDGNEYSFEKYKFHESVNEKGILTATVMKKIPGYSRKNARIIGIRNHDPEDNDFDRDKIDQSKANFYLEEVLKKMSNKTLADAYYFIMV